MPRVSFKENFFDPPVQNDYWEEKTSSAAIRIVKCFYDNIIWIATFPSAGLTNKKKQILISNAEGGEGN